MNAIVAFLLQALRTHVEVSFMYGGFSWHWNTEFTGETQVTPQSRFHKSQANACPYELSL